MQQQFYHIYIGTAFQTSVYASSEQEAIRRHAAKVGRSPMIFQAKGAANVQDLKRPKERKNVRT